MIKNVLGQPMAKEPLAKYLAIILTAICVFVGIVYGYASLQTTVNDHTRRIQQVEDCYLRTVSALNEVQRGLAVTSEVQQMMLQELRELRIK